MIAVAALLLCATMNVFAYRSGAGQCDVPATKEKLTGMADRDFVAGAGPAQVLTVPATAAAGSKIDIKFTTSTDNIMGYLVAAKKGADFFGKFEGTKTPTSCSAGTPQADATATHSAAVDAKMVTLSYNVPAAAAKGDKITFSAVVLAGVMDNGQKFYTLSGETTVGDAPAATTVTTMGGAGGNTTTPSGDGKTTVTTSKPGSSTAAPTKSSSASTLAIATASMLVASLLALLI